VTYRFLAGPLHKTVESAPDIDRPHLNIADRHRTAPLCWAFARSFSNRPHKSLPSARGRTDIKELHSRAFVQLLRHADPPSSRRNSTSPCFTTQFGYHADRRSATATRGHRACPSSGQLRYDHRSFLDTHENEHLHQNGGGYELCDNRNVDHLDRDVYHQIVQDPLHTHKLNHRMPIDSHSVSSISLVKNSRPR
jgi:hypothetical protein